MNAPRLKIAIGIATAGRRETLMESVAILKRQIRLPDILAICPLASDNVGQSDFADFPATTSVVIGPKGLCAQRNMILSIVPDADVIIFFDDDFIADPNYLANIEKIFLSNPDVGATTGHLLADDATGPGLGIASGLDILNHHAYQGRDELQHVFGLYGCNMAFRMQIIRDHSLRFDENLPLYGWQEDVDFSLQVVRFGRLVKSDKLLGVHLGVKAGRTSGIRLGYSQIVNPVYLVRKGTMSWRHAWKLMSRNFAANLARSLYPEPWIDRFGRLKGNLIALTDVAMGRASPMKILQL